MKPDHSEILDDLLSKWHCWQQARPCRGYASKSAGFEQYRASRQYDDTNGALDSDLDAARSEQVDFEVSEMQEPYKAAIYASARNLATGIAVWASPRLPLDAALRGQIVDKARMMLCARLCSAGVI
jgi:hypothetical protein